MSGKCCLYIFENKKKKNTMKQETCKALYRCVSFETPFIKQIPENILDNSPIGIAPKNRPVTFRLISAQKTVREFAGWTRTGEPQPCHSPMVRSEFLNSAIPDTEKQRVFLFKFELFSHALPVPRQKDGKRLGLHDSGLSFNYMILMMLPSISHNLPYTILTSCCFLPK